MVRKSGIRLSAAPFFLFIDLLYGLLFHQDFSTIAKTPGFTDLLKEGILLDNFNAITHPSEPNYVAAAGGDNFGIINDDYYNIPANVSSIFDLLEQKGLTWKVYQEDIPSVGYTGYKAGNYVRKHNPAIIFDSVGLNKTRAQNVVGGKRKLFCFCGVISIFLFKYNNLLLHYR